MSTAEGAQQANEGSNIEREKLALRQVRAALEDGQREGADEHWNREQFREALRAFDEVHPRVREEIAESYQPKEATK
ncbi:MAG: hypothetical protein Q7R59_02095 [bacterium]|nr:hypothetical protein [bacterium]